MNTAYMLMDLGHSVLEAPSGPNALQILESDAQFDVIITDYSMPGMTGLDLAEKIKRLRPKIPIIIATGYAELPPGANLEFPRLSKPYSQQELSEALDRASRSRAVFQLTNSTGPGWPSLTQPTVRGIALTSEWVKGTDIRTARAMISIVRRIRSVGGRVGSAVTDDCC